MLSYRHFSQRMLPYRHFPNKDAFLQTLSQKRCFPSGTFPMRMLSYRHFPISMLFYITDTFPTMMLSYKYFSSQKITYSNSFTHNCCLLANTFAQKKLLSYKCTLPPGGCFTLTIFSWKFFTLPYVSLKGQWPEVVLLIRSYLLYVADQR